MTKNLLYILLFFSINTIIAQSYETKDYIVSKNTSIEIGTLKKDFFPHLQSLEAPSPDGNSYSSFLEREKNRLFNNNSYKNDEYLQVSSTVAKPLVLRGFEGNEFDDGVPTDNNIAISNSGKIISVINSTIYMYDEVIADTPIYKVSLEAFTDTASTQAFARKFDPKVSYDPKQDKFILVYLAGSGSTATNIVVCFSETNNPLGIWHQYALPGNPFANTTWSDYPIVAQSDSEVFVTINLVYDDSTWQAGFAQSLIWQINKSDGYTGSSTLHSRMWSNIGIGGAKIRNLCPMQGGSTTYGPEMYLMSNRNFSASNDSFFVLKINNTQYNSPTLDITVGRANKTYGLAPNAKQKFSLLLQTNDSRILGGYIENNKIHFVGNTVNDNNNRCAVYHGIVSEPIISNSIELNKIQDTAYDYGYPNIAYTGSYAGDEQAIIGFDYTSQDTFPGINAVFYEKWAGYSDPVTVKSGLSQVNVLPGNLERWGDYFGIQRKYNEAGTVWLSGFYGKKQPGVGNPFANYSWISSLKSPYTVPQNIESTNNNNHNAIVYPNPANEKTSITFELDTKQWIDISIYDIKCNLVQILYRDIAKAGGNLFSFITTPLSNGNYIIQVKNNQEILFSKKLLVNN
jgi:hypothetical protein